MSRPTIDKGILLQGIVALLEEEVADIRIGFEKPAERQLISQEECRVDTTRWVLKRRGWPTAWPRILRARSKAWRD